MAVTFSEQNQKQIEDILSRYPTKQAALLPVLNLAQEEFGWISQEVMQLVAATLDLPLAHVYGVVTFYTMYHQKPIGRHCIEVCRTLSCAMMGSDKITQHIKNRLGIEIGETTLDNRYTLLETECLASCGTAPAARVDGAYYENLTVDQLDGLLESLK